MDRTYEVALAVCTSDTFWSEETVKVSLNDDCGDGHTQEEIWGAACHEWHKIHKEHEIPCEALGLVAYEEITESHLERKAREAAVCCVCGNGFTKAEWNERHTPHEPDCPQRKEPLPEGCVCDLNAHANCCLDCNKPKGNFECAECGDNDHPTAHCPDIQLETLLDTGGQKWLIERRQVDQLVEKDMIFWRENEHAYQLDNDYNIDDCEQVLGIELRREEAQ